MTPSPLDDGRLLSWEAFRISFLEPAVGADIPVPGVPRITLFVEPAARRIGVRVRDADGDVPATPMRAVSIDRRGDEVVVATAERELFQPFYALLLDLSDRVQLDGASVGDAILDVLRVWRRLLANFGGLSDDEQLGLSGELWTLKRLIATGGSEAVGSWLGPTGNPHDFRTEAGEIEVKTTRGAQRRHTISRVEQLAASPGRDLFLLSLQFTDAGTGGSDWTLTEQVSDVREAIGTSPEAARRFALLLEAVGWHENDAPLYVRRWCLRSEPRLVRVDAFCPRITPDLLAEMIGERAGRIDEMRYRVNVDGLGVPDGHSEFLSVLPNAK